MVSAENDFAFSFSVSFSVETQNENTEIEYSSSDQFKAWLDCLQTVVNGPMYNG